MVLGKNSLRVKDIRCIFIEVILNLAHGNRKITVLFNCGVDEDFISQRFTKENGLEATPIKRMGIIVDGYNIIIYRFYNIIIKVKDSRSEVRTTQRTFYVINI